MVSANIALIIMIIIIFLLALILPLLDSVKGFKDSISTRWSIVVVYLALGIGCVIDFEKIRDDTRHFVLLGCFVVSILYIVFISLEKWFSNKWIGKFGVTLKKGDSIIHAGMSDTDTKAEGVIPESPVTVDMGMTGKPSKPSKHHEHKNQETEEATEASDTKEEQSPSPEEDELDTEESDASEELNDTTEEDGDEDGEEEKEA